MSLTCPEARGGCNMPFPALEELSNQEKRLLLINLDEAKRLEFDRRRKLRIQQVRQQSKDLASSVRQKVTEEGRRASKLADREARAEAQERKERLLKSLRDSYNRQISEVGSAHRNASNQPNLSIIEQEKQEVLDVIKRARSTIAAQKQKAEQSFIKESLDLAKKRKEMVRAVEDMRASVICSSGKMNRVITRKNGLKEQSPTKMKKTKSPLKSKPQKEVSFHPDEISESTSHSAIGEVVRLFGQVLHPTESTIPSPRGSDEVDDSPPAACYSPSRFRSRSSESPTPSRSPPLRSIYTSPHSWRVSDGEDDNLSDVSCSSDVTWPPPSRLTKAYRSKSLIQLYDSKTRRTTEVENTFGRVSRIDPTSLPDMRSEIAEEEAALNSIEVMKSASKEKLSKRSTAALRSARLRKNFQDLLTNLSQQEKKKRVRMAVEGTYPAEFHMTAERKKEMKQKGILKNLKGNETEGSDKFQDTRKVPSSLKAKPKKAEAPLCQKVPVSSEESAKTLSVLVDRLQKEREKCLRQNLAAGDSRDVEIEDEEKELQHWISCPDKCNRTPQSSPQKLKPSPQKTRSPEKHTQTPVKENRSPGKQDHSPNKGKTSPSKHPRSPDRVCCTPEKVPRFSDCGAGERFHNYRVSPSSSQSISDSSDMEPAKPIEVRAEVHSPPKRRQCEIQAYPANIQYGSGNKEKESSRNEEDDTAQSSSPNNNEADNDGSFDGLTIVLKVCENKSQKNKFGPVKEVTVLDNSKKHPTREKVFLHECEDSSQNGKQTTNVSVRTFMNVNDDCAVHTTPTQGTSVRTPHSGNSSSTSYMSPPEDLTPEQLKILNKVLTRVGSKTKNPKLHNYITRLLHMSRESIEDLAVSVSEVSLQSDLVREMESSKAWDSNCSPTHPSRSSPKYVHCTSSACDKRRHCPPRRVYSNRPPSFSSDNSTTDTEHSRACKSGLENEKLDTDIDNDQSTQFDRLAEKYTKRINDLVRLVDAVHVSCSSSMDKSELSLHDASSYLNIPTNINSSLPMSNSVKKMAERGEYPRLDQSHMTSLCQPTPSSRRENYQSSRDSCPPNLGVSRNLFPRPFDEGQCELDTPGPSRPKPPTTLGNIRKSIPHASPHELSTIHEGDTPLPSQLVAPSDRQSELVPEVPLLMDSSFPPPLSDTDSEVSSIRNSPVKRGERESDLPPFNPPLNRSLATPLSDISNSPRLRDRGLTTETSSSDFEDVFQSLGIGWALSTLRKTRAANKLQVASSSSSLEGSPLRCRASIERSLSRSKGFNHSTPVKQPLSRPPSKFEKNLKSSFHASFSQYENFNLSLTPPDLYLSAPPLQSTKLA